jgi:transketolase
MNNCTQRDLFFKMLYEKALTDKDIILIVADISAPTLDDFRKNLPNQFINAGISEQNAILIATGLAKEHKKVYVYSIAPFITLRCFEQIRISCGISGIPLNIIGMGTGLSYFNDGPTHHLIEDISIMRVIPNINIWNLTDNIITSKCFEETYIYDKCNYIRFDKDIYPEIYLTNINFKNGFHCFNSNKDYFIISSGVFTHSILGLHKELGIIDIFKIPFNTDAFIQIVKSSKKLITVEEHFLTGGLGSIVLETLSDYKLNIPVYRIGIDRQIGYSKCFTYGGREIIRKELGLDKESILNKINNYISN